MNKKNLLSIGEMSKFTGVSIHSLRYYERINVLSPVYIDEETKYRYYSFNQIYLVEFITACIAMDIPLKDLPKFTQKDETVDIRAFLDEGKTIAMKKLSATRQGLQLIKEIERQIDIAETHKPGEIYTRHVAEKCFYIHKYSTSPLELAPADMARELMAIPFEDNDYNYSELEEYGFYAEYDSCAVTEPEYFAYMAVPLGHGYANEKIIPAGEYFCVISEDSQIQKAPQIFEEHLKGRPFIAVETEIYAAKYKISQPLNELRVIAT